MNPPRTPADRLAGPDLFAPAWIELAGVANMRDVGGLPTCSGGRIRSGRLIRSDNLQDLTGDDIGALLRLGVTDVVDLRAAQEVTAEGPGPLLQTGRVAHHHHSLLPDRDRAASAADALAASPSSGRDESSGRTDADDCAADRSDPEVVRAGQYRSFLEQRPDSVTAALQVIARGQGATVVHCAAGKDRTGVVIAMALDIAAVPPEVIVADYARSAERVPAILSRLARSDFYAADPATYSVPDQTPTPGSMRLFLAALTEQVGGAAEWLRLQGWELDDLDRLRAKLAG